MTYNLIELGLSDSKGLLRNKEYNRAKSAQVCGYVVNDPLYAQNYKF